MLSSHTSWFLLLVLVNNCKYQIQTLLYYATCINSKHHSTSHTRTTTHKSRVLLSERYEYTQVTILLATSSIIQACGFSLGTRLPVVCMLFFFVVFFGFFVCLFVCLFFVCFLFVFCLFVLQIYALCMSCGSSIP